MQIHDRSIVHSDITSDEGDMMKVKREPEQLYLYEVACKFDNKLYQRKTAILLAASQDDAHKSVSKHYGVLEIIFVKEISGPFRNQQILYFG